MNAVLVNDMRKSIFRRSPVLGTAYSAAAILVLTLGVNAVASPGSLRPSRDLAIWRLPELVLPVIAPLFAASAFAKEHEQRTWQDVLLTRLSAGEIIAGKFLASFTPTLIALCVLAPPLALILIVQGVTWALDPGPWMLVLAAKFVTTAACYVALALTASYHSPNTRTGLAVSYGCLVAYGLANYVLWGAVVPILVGVLGDVYGPGSYGSYGGYAPATVGTPYYAPHWNGPTDQFALTLVDWLMWGQCVVLTVGMLAYLAVRVRGSRG